MRAYIKGALHSATGVRSSILERPSLEAPGSAALANWQERLAHARAGLRAVEAIRPILMEWVHRRDDMTD